MLTRFLSSLFNGLHRVSTAYYKAKGIALYRWVFKEFGKNSYIRKPLVIYNPSFMSIGKNVSIRDGVRLEVVCAGGRRPPQLIIEEETNIEQNVHIVCQSLVHIGRNVTITANCAVVDVTHPFDNVRDTRKVGERIQDEDSFVEIGDGSFIGFGAVILPNVRIGKHAVIGANSVVAKDIPDYTVAAGVPAVVLKRYDFSMDCWVKAAPSAAPVL